MAGVAPLPGQRHYRVVLLTSCGVAVSAASVFHRAPTMFAQQSCRTSSFGCASSAKLDAGPTVPVPSHCSKASGRRSADLARLSLLGAFALGATMKKRQGGPRFRHGRTTQPAATSEVEAQVAPAVEEASEEAASRPGAKAKARPKAKVKKTPGEPIEKQLTEGIFAPLVLAGYALLGEPFVERVRGKGIELHSRVINAFSETFNFTSKRRQGFIKTAKKTGHDLGFLVKGGFFGDGLFGEKALDWYEQSGFARL
jgi:hypothetical protein